MAETKNKVLHKKSVQKGLVPTGNTLDYGEVAVNYNNEEPFLSIRTDDNNYVKFLSEKKINEIETTISENSQTIAQALLDLDGRLTGITESFSDYTENNNKTLKFKNKDGNVVEYNGQSDADLTGGIAYATSASTATYASKFGNANGNYTWDLGTQNTNDTWVPVMGGGKLQYRAIPKDYNTPASGLTVGKANKLGDYTAADFLKHRITSDVTFLNEVKLNGTLSNGTAVDIMRVGSSNSLTIGYGMAGVGDTYISGNNVILRYGTGRTEGLKLTSDGNLTMAGNTVYHSGNLTKATLGLGNVENYGVFQQSAWKGQIQYVLSNTGIVEIGNRIDMHNEESATNDYTVSLRIQTGENTKRKIYLPSSEGTLALTSYVDSEINSKLVANDAMLYKGTLTAESSFPKQFKAGWTYKIATSGTYFGQKLEVGDMVIAVQSTTSDVTTTSSNFATYWTAIQVNIDGHVSGPASATDGNFALFDGTTGKLIKDSSYSPSSFVLPDGSNVTANTKWNINTRGLYAPYKNSTSVVETKGGLNYYYNIPTSFATWCTGYNNAVLNISRIDSEGYSSQLGFSGAGLYYRHANNKTWSDWEQVITQTNNVDISTSGKITATGGFEGNASSADKVKTTNSTSKAYLAGTTTSGTSTSSIVTNSSVYMSGGKLYVGDDEVASKTQMDDALEVLTASFVDLTDTIIENEEVIAEALNDLNERTNSLEQNVPPMDHSSTATTYGVAGTNGVYGHVTLISGNVDGPILVGPGQAAAANHSHTLPTASTGKTGVVKLINGDLSVKSYAQGEAAAASHTHSNYLPLSGGTMTGNISGGTSVTITAGKFLQASDETLKDFHGDIDVDFNKLKEIPKKYYTWKGDSDGELELGTSAQKLQEVYPELVGTNGDTLTVDYARLSIVALKAIDKLNEENQMLRNELNEIKKHLGL